MKSNFFAKALTLLAGISLVLAARADITTGLIGYWSLSDGPGASTVTDLTGNGNNGTLTNFTDGTYNNMWTSSSDTNDGWPFAMLFNQSGEGANTYINVPDSSVLNTPSANRTWTLSAWVKCSEAGTAEPRYAGIIAKGNQGAEAYALYMNDTAGTGKFSGIFHNASLGSAEVATSTTVAQNGVWYHVAVTVLEPKSSSANAEAILYVNGVAESGANANTYTTVYSTNLPVTIGCRRLSSGDIGAAFAGTIDDVRIYSRALSANDIAQLYANKAFAPNNSGIGYWNGSAGNGGNATLDTASLNFCTNIYSAPVGTAASLGNVLTLDNGSALPPSVTFASTYYSNSLPIAVAATNLTIAPGGLAVATANAPGTINFANNLATTFILNSSDSIGIKDGANPTSLVQSGNGTAILTGVNTFSGGVTINWGTVQVGNGGTITGQELGTGSVTDNSTLAFSGNNSAIFNSAISGTGVVIQKGSGTTTLTGANTYTGGTTITSGALTVNSLSDSGSPAGTGSVTLGGGTLNYTGASDSTARQFTGIAGTTNTIDVTSGANLEITGRVTGSAAWVVNKVDSGTLTLSGSTDNSFLGMNVNGGTVILNKNSTTAIHAIGNPLTVNSGGTVQLSGSSNYQIANNANSPVTINSGGVFDANSQSQTFNKLALSGTGSGSGALINSAASTTSTMTALVVLAGGATIGGAGSITLPSVVSGTGGLTYAGTGTLTLSAANTYSGATVVSSGLLDGIFNGAIPGNVAVTGTGTLSLDTAAILSPTAILTLPASPGTGIVNLNFSGTQTISALFIGTTSMPGGTYGAPGSGATHENAAFQNVGILYVAQTFWDANHTDAGSQSSANGGGSGNWNNATASWWVSGNADTIWSPGNVAYFAGTAGTVTLNDNVTAAGLTVTAPNYNLNNTDGTSALTLSGTAPTVTIPQGTTTIGCAIAGSGTVTVSGPGTLNLSGANTYSGGTTIAGGTTVNANTISDSGSSSLGVGGANVMLGTVGGQGANLNFTGSSGLTASQVTLNGTNSSVLNVPSGSSLELDGQVRSGTTTAAPLLTLTGGGTLTLGGSGDNAALTMAIQKGNVIITKNSASTAHGLGGGSSSIGTGTVGNSAILQLSGSGGFDLFNTCVLTVNSPDGMLDLNGQNDSMSTLTLSGSGPTGVGALINSAASTLSLLNNTGSGMVLAGPTTIGGVGDIGLQGKVTGSGPLTYIGSGTLSLSNANTFSAGTVVSAGSTVAFANNAGAAGSGAVTVNANGTLVVALVGNNVIFPNTITGTGTVNLQETSANNLQLGGSMSTFTGVLNCPTSPGGAAKAQILTTAVNINSAATINVAAGGTFYVANSGVTIACTVNLYGTGNSETYGALRIENGALISGPVTLFGNTTMGNGAAGPAKLATISGAIHESGGSYGITFTSEPGTIVLSGVNTYSGPTTINKGVLIISGAGQLGSGNYAGDILNNASNLTYASTAPQTLSGVISGSGMLIEGGPGTLTLTGANAYTGDTWVTNGSTLVVAGSGSLGAANANNYAGNILDNGTFTDASSTAQTLSGTISGTGGVTATGSSILTLAGANSYTGNTLITNGATLVLTGSIDTTPSIAIAAGSTLDASAIDPYTMNANTTLQASGTGTAVTAAMIKGGSSVTLGSMALNFKPQSFSGDASHPALYVSAGSLTLNGPGLTVNNATGTPLGVGTYSIIQASGSLTLANNSVTVTGAGLAAGTTASLSMGGVNLNLVVTSGGAIPQPKITNITYLNGNVMFGGTNGPKNGTYYVLASTNVGLSLTNWTSIATNNFDSAGAFAVTNTPQGTAQRFYLIDIRTP